MHIGLFCISDLGVHARPATISSASPGGLQSCRTTAQVLEQSSFINFIDNSVPLVNCSSLELAVFVIIKELRPFLETQTEKVAEVALRVV